MTCHDVPAPGEGFTCGACPSGFAGNDGITCIDIDDCVATLIDGSTGNPCGANGTCTDIGANDYDCSCDPGYLFAANTGGSCEEIRMCAVSADSLCDANARCNHVGPGQHSCTCFVGYTGADGSLCFDTDACLDNPCFPGATCHDVPAPGEGFTCGSCPTGWAGNGINCTDTDDCAGIPCGAKGTCADTGAVAYDCNCTAGYMFAGGTCEEVRPCDLNEDNCHINATCNHEAPGQHSCTCDPGFSGPGEVCVDTDGCANTPCFVGAAAGAVVRCTDVPAPADGYMCRDCPSGYNGDGEVCHDVDDCVGNPCGMNGNCTDVGANIYHCSCSGGFLFANGTCEEIFPCDRDEDNCDTNAICNHESPGQRSCTCTAGYSGTGEACVDTDGCLGNPCFAGVSCTDVPAPNDRYSCSSCPSGYNGNGEVCHDIDDCSGVPCGANGNCTDTGANSYDCSCDQGFMFAAGTCEEIRPCDRNEDNCHNNATCNHESPGRHSCSCNIGYAGSGEVCVDIDGCDGTPCYAGVNCTDVAAPMDGFICEACAVGMVDLGQANAQGITCHDPDCDGAPCGMHGSCVDTGIGDYRCDCDPAWRFTNESTVRYGWVSTCSEIQPCLTGEDDCDTNAVCSHTGPGQHSCACGTGYSGNGTYCYDTDGCAGSPCHALSQCLDELAPNVGYTCGACPQGYVGSGESCTEVRPCDDGSHNCDNDAICGYQGPDQFNCTCDAGFSGPGTTCIDTDGCLQSPCFPTVVCHDEPAPLDGRACGDCPAGFAGDGQNCTDIDDCAGAPCGSFGNCTDTGVTAYSCSCVTGYMFAAGTCEEIRPCLRNEDNCHSNAICNHEAPGTHSCTCTVGYSGSGQVCADTDGCLGNTQQVCFTGVVCHDEPAPLEGFTCESCPTGFAGDGQNCSDINDCANNPCGNGTCTDTGAVAYDCNCTAGYIFAAGTCEEVLPCAAGEDDCDANSVCNHEGPGHHSCTCIAGYSGTGQVCVDTNGCANNPCFVGAAGEVVRCTDVPAPADGYICDDCPSGYNGDGEVCHDVDDCVVQWLATNGMECGGHGNCTDTGVNSYDCACETGYLFAASTCEEIRPCDLNEDNCHINATCNHEAPGQHSCTCDPGFSGPGEVCVDTDGCANNPCYTGVACVDVAAPNDGYQCGSCPVGYNGNGEVCHDLDDCVGNPCGTNGNCTDAGVDIYDCSCAPGWRDFGRATAGIGTVCEEVRPCDTGEDDCNANALCNNLSPGQHSCSCNAGYSGDGRVCTDIDGCAGTNPCYTDAELTVNCTDVAAPADDFSCDVCPEGMVDLGELKQGVTCHDPDCDGSPCGQHGTCIDMGINNYTCDCDIGYRSDTLTGFRTCSEIRPCLTGEDNCDTNAVCSHDGPGQHTCACDTGYSGNGTSCSDADACAGDPCSLVSQCLDEPPPSTGYTCGACPSGYSGNGHQCDPSPCLSSADVVFSRDPSDPTACDARGHPGGAGYMQACQMDQGCVYGQGACRLRTVATGNELASGSNISLQCSSWSDYYVGTITLACNYGSLTVPNNSCACKAGFSFDPSGQCIDTDGCQESPCFESVSCADVSAPGDGRICGQCPSGFSGDGETCTDVDDCAPDPCGAGGNCTDTGANSYACACAWGYLLVNETVATADGVASSQTCSEIRQCSNGEDDCDQNALCNHESPGRHSCTCNEGYSGPGNVCNDTDGCLGDPCYQGVACSDVPAPSGPCVNVDCGVHGTCDQQTGVCICEGHTGTSLDFYSWTGVRQPGVAACDTYNGKATCWSGAYTYDRCCNPQDGSGDPSCWFGAVQYDSCKCVNDAAPPAPLPPPPGGYVCDPCPSGFSGDGESCSDIDDCIGNPCGFGNCTDTGANTYACDCDTGYHFGTRDGGNPSCDEVRICAASQVAASCDTDARCDFQGEGDTACTCYVRYDGLGKHIVYSFSLS